VAEARPLPQKQCQDAPITVSDYIIATSGQLYLIRAVDNSLCRLDQRANTLGVRLAMPVAGERVRAAAGLNQDVRPDQSCLNVDGSHLGHADADLVFAEP